MDKIYILELDNRKIGVTKFEFADVPMGVVYGKIIFEKIVSPYELFKEHCLKFKVGMNVNDSVEKLIDTSVIPELKVVLENGNELKGWGGSIVGMDDDDFEIQFGGITSEIMQTEFSNHFKEYYLK